MVEVTEIISRALLKDEQRACLPASGSGEPLAQVIRRRIGPKSELIEMLAARVNGRLELIEKSGPTLDAWLAHGGNLSAAAQAMGAHRNSLRYRLDNLFRETGLRPDCAQDLETLVMVRAMLRPTTEFETPPGDIE
ncbi:PucR family transcriptional regulator [Marinobacter nanhaiticus D15-8W]|uniref:PucR family transcriptional regulator n=2 Tax=Marinobacter TaxID=2742 RepID=A0A371CG99_9GAMM|nr:PucR family transcriptional regulator [Marinobacter nanhaiticus D15-8W]